MTAKSPAQLALIAYFARPKALTQREVACRLGLKEGTVWTWKVGTRRPAAEQRAALEKLIGVDASLWLTPSERRSLDKIKAA